MGLNIDSSVQPRLMKGSDVIESLRTDRKVAISFIQAREETQSLVNLGRPVEEILDGVETSGQYRCRVVDDHLIAYPASGSFEQVVTIPAGLIEDVTRHTATMRLSMWLKEHVAGFEDLVNPLYLGSGNAPEPERITITGSARVVDHLAKLLGPDTQRVFTLDGHPSGVPWVKFRIVAWDQGAIVTPKADAQRLLGSDACTCGIESFGDEQGTCPATCTTLPVGPEGATYKVTYDRVTLGEAAAGMHALDWDGRTDAGRQVPTGVYIAKLEVAGEQPVTQRLTLIR
jgi:hypothetical protein